jgi:hypothetical protein
VPFRNVRLWHNPHMQIRAARPYDVARAVLIALLGLFTAGATTVQSLSFGELTDRSDLIVSGAVTRTWSDWDAEHKFIWTHNELTVSTTLKGTAGKTVVVSEPGGIVGIQGMTVAGTSVYRAGDKVVLFLSRMPNGYLRTTGWGQGKYSLDDEGRIHADTSLRTLEISAGAGSAAESLQTLNGMTLSDLTARVRARTQAGRLQ